MPSSTRIGAANVQPVIDGVPNQWAQAEIQPARAPARANRARPQDMVQEFLDGQEQRQQVAPRANGYGYWVSPVREDTSGQIAFTSEEAAKTYATELAGKNPRVMYGVFQCTSVFETTEPVVVVKEYNDSGELIVQQSEEAENA